MLADGKVFLAPFHIETKQKATSSDSCKSYEVLFRTAKYLYNIMKQSTCGYVTYALCTAMEKLPGYVCPDVQNTVTDTAPASFSSLTAATAQMISQYRCLTSRQLKPDRLSPRCLRLTSAVFLLVYLPQDQFCFDKLRLYKVSLTSKDSHCICFSGYCETSTHYLNEQGFQGCRFVNSTVLLWNYRRRP